MPWTSARPRAPQPLRWQVSSRAGLPANHSSSRRRAADVGPFVAVDLTTRRARVERVRTAIAQREASGRSAQDAAGGEVIRRAGATNLLVSLARAASVVIPAVVAVVAVDPAV